MVTIEDAAGQGAVGGGRCSSLGCISRMIAPIMFVGGLNTFCVAAVAAALAIGFPCGTGGARAARQDNGLINDAYITPVVVNIGFSGIVRPAVDGWANHAGVGTA